MKKLIAIALLLCMAFSLAACGSSEAEYKLGMGIVLSTDSSSSENHNAQVDATVAAVVLDKDNKIVACRIDCAQNKMDVTDGQVDPAKAFLSKAELKEDYNMVKYSDATLEWYQQAANFEQYAVGKTAEEILAAETTVNEEGHTVFVDETLYASVSISIADFQAAVAKACADEQGMSFKAGKDFKMGLAVNSEASESTAATADAEGVVKMYSEFAAVVVDANGKVLANLQDATQPKININAAGEITGADFKGTKRELKEDYNMVAYSNATLEWYQQAANFEQYANGKTAAELQGVETVVNEEGHQVFADQELYASVSISIDGMTAVLVKAIGNAR